MTRINIVLLSILCFAGIYCLSDGEVFAQERSGKGEVNVMQDSRLEELLKRHAFINSEKEGIPGYRIRIFSESGHEARNNATNARAEFYEKYPDIEAHLVYDEPNFKVYVGDFRTKSQALKVLSEIDKDYPRAFIVSTYIDPPPLEENND